MAALSYGGPSPCVASYADVL